jgi:hypothetical protein
METLSNDALAPEAGDVIPVAPFQIAGGPARALGQAIAKRLRPGGQARRKPPHAIVFCGRCIVVRPVGFLCEHDGHLVFTSTG